MALVLTNVPKFTFANADEEPTLHLFPRLHIELRFLIWDFAVINNPRRNIKFAFINPSRPRDGLKASCSIPPILHTIKESPKIALKRYTLMFRKSLNGRPIYVDMTKDALKSSSMEVDELLWETENDFFESLYNNLYEY